MSTSTSVNSASLPKPVQRQLRRMNDIIKAREAVDSPAPAETPAPPPGAAAEATPSPVPSTPSPAPAPAKGEPTTEEGRYWHQRFKVTEGMFRKQREQHATELAQRDARIAELQGEVTRLSSTTSTETAAPDLSKFLSAEQIDAVGEEQARIIVSSVVKAARSEAQALVDAKLGPIEQRAKTDERAALRRRVEAFEDALTDAVPEWRELNEDPRFLAWLTEEDEATGMTRQDVATQSGASLNPKPTVRLLREFKASLNAADVPSTPQVAPASTGSQGGPAPAPAVVAEGAPTREEIKRHFKLRSLNKLSQDEIKKFDARLKAAEQSGIYR